MQARKTARVPVPPRLTAEQAIPLIKGQIARLDELLRVLYSDPRIGTWENATRDILDQTFGKPDGASHAKTTQLLNAPPGPLLKKSSPAESQGKHVIRCQSRKTILAAYIEELEFGIAQSLSAPPSNGQQAAGDVYTPPPGTNGKQHEPASMEIAFREGLSRTTAAFWERPSPPKSDAEFLNEFRKTAPQPGGVAPPAPPALTPAAGEAPRAKAALGPNFLEQVDRVSAALARFGSAAHEAEPPHAIAGAPSFLEAADRPSPGFLEDVEALEAVVAQSMSIAPSHAEMAAPALEPAIEPVIEHVQAHAAIAEPKEPAHQPAAEPGPAEQPAAEQAVAAPVAATAQVEEMPAAAGAPAVLEPAPAESQQVEVAAVEAAAVEAPGQALENSVEAEASVAAEPAQEAAPEIAGESTEAIAAPAEPVAAEATTPEAATQSVESAAPETTAPQAAVESAPEANSDAVAEASMAPEVVEPQIAAAGESDAEPSREHEAPAEVASDSSSEDTHAPAEVADEIAAEPVDAAVAVPISAAIFEAAPEAVAETAAAPIVEPEAPVVAESVHAASGESEHAAAEEPVQAEAAQAETPTLAEASEPEAAQEPAPVVHASEDASPAAEEPPAEEVPEFDRDPVFAAHLDSALAAPVSAEWIAFAAEVELRTEETPAFVTTASDIAARSNGHGAVGPRTLEEAALSDVCVHAVADYECGDADALAASAAKPAWHPEIERASGDLMRDGRWADAALAAYGRVVDEVRSRSRLPMDGDSLMNHAFSCDGKSPAIAFNSLRSDAERDEQRGMMNLFKGAAGLRSARSYSDALFGDPCKAREHLALASMLLRALDSSNGPS